MKRRATEGDAITPLDVVSMGEAVWDLVTPRGQTFATAPSLRLRPGGAAVNVALALARRGWKTGLAATVGADALGDALAARVAASGVSTALVERAPPRTGLVLVEQAPARTPRIVGYRQADEAVPALPAGWRARLLVLTGILPGEAQAERFEAAAQAARQQGSWVVVDLNARPRVWRGHTPSALPPAWIANADVVKASADDLTTMGLDRSALRAALGRSAVLIVTAGPRAARAFGQFGEVVFHPSPGAGCAMSAGDAFTAGICDALLDARVGRETDAASWERALRRAHALARRVVVRERPAPGSPEPK